MKLFVAALFLATPAYADVPFMNCTLERNLPSEPANLADATLKTYTSGDVDWIEIIGTHQDFDPRSREPQKKRGFRLVQMQPESTLRSWVFSNLNSSGVFSMDDTGHVDLSVHVQGADHTYVELFSGPCKDLS